MLDIDRLPSAAFVANASGDLIHANPEFAALFGLPLAECLADGWLEALHPGDRDRIVQAWNTAILRREPFRERFRLRDPAGRMRSVQMRVVGPTPTEPGGGLIGSVEDLSSVLVAEEALAAERKRVVSVLAGTGAGTWEWNVQTGDFRVDERWVGMLGWTLAEWNPRTLAESERALHPDDIERSDRMVAKHLAGETDQYEFEYRFTHRDGHIVWVLDRGRVITRTPDGEPEWMYGTHVDISRLKEQEQQLRRVAQEAELANRAKSEFLATMSHEIRTPLHAILGLLQLLQDSGLTLDQSQSADLARNSALSLMGIVDDVLDLSKVEAGRLELESVPFEPAAHLAAAGEMLRERAEAKGLGYEVSVSADLPDMLKGDPHRLRQVVLNLLSNAVKFTERGAVRLEVGGHYADDETFLLQLRVRDTGIGMDDETVGRLFIPFAQADASTTRVYGGTGLGLTICDRLITIMQGSLQVTSRPGEGSTFMVTVPLARYSHTVATTPSSDGGAPGVDPEARRLGEGVVVLVAEDNPVNRKVASAMLERVGCTVRTAKDGGEALQIATAGGVDVVLMDVHMPVMDGYDAARQIRDWERSQAAIRTPIVAFTANVMPEEKAKCLASGMDDYLSKPVNREVLYETLERVLRPGGREQHLDG